MTRRNMARRKGLAVAAGSLQLSACTWSTCGSGIILSCARMVVLEG